MRRNIQGDKKMKFIYNFVFYTACFVLLARTVYQLIFIVPPLPGDIGYDKFRLLSLLMSVLIGAVIVIMFIISEKWRR